MGERIHSIDSLRAVAIFFVVVAHTHPFHAFRAYGNYVYFVLDTIGQFDVPFFFLTAGYFFAMKAHRENVVRLAANAARKLGSMYLFGASTYLLALTVLTVLITVVGDGNVTNTLLTHFPDDLSLVGLLYYGDSIAVPLWFLTALIFSIGFVSVFVALGKTGYLLPVATSLHVLGLIGQNYPMLLDVPFPTRDAVFFGFFYVALGFHVQSVNWTPKEAHGRYYLGAIGVFLVLQLLEQYAVGYFLPGRTLAQGIFTTEYTVSTVFLVLAVFAYALSKPNWSRETSLPMLGEYAVGIYLIHAPVYQVFEMLNGASMATGGFDFRTTLLWHVLITPTVYVLSLAVYILIARAGIVEIGGSHFPWLDRLRARFTSTSDSAPTGD
jgi:peptidoglycan/LPS O-acetylase OafA/YrhL